MKPLVKVENLYVEYLGRKVLDIEELELYPYDRIGLVGANGAGKSTLLKVLVGERPVSEGQIVREGRLAYIPQLDEPVAGEGKNFALLGKMGVASKLDDERRSGGEETRLKIALAMSEAADGILADEPTSHLDREGIQVLISQCRQITGALLVISHDRDFLDQVVDKIWELKDGKIAEYWGGYSDYLAQKEEERRSQAEQFKQWSAERVRLEKAIAEAKSQARKMEQKARASGKNKSESGGRLGHQKTTGSKQKKLHQAARNMEHRMEALGKPEAPETLRTIRFRQSPALALHNPFPIIGNDLVKRYGDKVIFERASFQFPLGAKIAITGANGTGKSTLFQMILNREDGIVLSPKAQLGYFAQDSYKTMRDQKVLEYLLDECDYPVSEVRAVLAAMGVSQQDIRKELAVLSGGEIIKLKLAHMLLGRYNILLLDEPSNFLDLPAVEALEQLMREYAGTILFITHDARLVDNVADIVYEVKDGNIIRID
ncbi:ABC-F type ribosomal protection protein [Xylanibacillus composti]|uniref:Msr family ABC-F type ribosomal protection protein n=1 Tax=Xylanibacillus composti TaxID=1572762 RepID=A0A8J4H413_9BACL|nr:ABC-F type ribosomal protection protein [Xylanibacillus composti]MDT9726334.1 ABC-F type ribosomal protection protein [Xylanibacillus composti]GIQ70558.1 Msr family ABC-F type ribosomal protection protein [Xylanibacillus composti]